MNKRERAQVVELLQCAADCCCDRPGDKTITAPYYEALAAVGSKHHHVAWLARCAVMVERFGDTMECGTVEYRDVLLEAAARVEEGSWP